MGLKQRQAYGERAFVFWDCLSSRALSVHVLLPNQSVPTLNQSLFLLASQTQCFSIRYPAPATTPSMEAPSITPTSQYPLKIRANTAYKAVGSFRRVVSDTTASGERHVNRAPIATFRQNAFIPHVLSHSVARQSRNGVSREDSTMVNIR
jgi:hypothetical protein